MAQDPYYSSPSKEIDYAAEAAYQKAHQSDSTSLPSSPSVTPVSMLDTNSAVSLVNNQKNYLDTAYPSKNNNIGNPGDQVLGQEAAVRAAQGADQSGKTKQDTVPPPTPSSKAYFVNAAGQEAEFTQDQLNDPATQRFLKDNNYALTKSDGLTVNSDFTVSSKEKAYNQATSDVENLTKDFLSYNVDNDPAYQAKATQITAQYDRLITAMKKTNEQRAQSFNTIGLRGGTTQYSNEVQLGITGDELRQANLRIGDLVTQENDALSAARTAFQNNNFTQFNNKVNALKDIRDQKDKELTKYNKILTDATDKIQKDYIFNQTVAKNTRDEVTRLAESGTPLDQISSTARAAYEKTAGLPAGSFDAFYQAIYDAKQAKNKEDVITAADKIVTFLQKIPVGQKITLNGSEYTGLGEDKNNQLFSETDKNGNVTYVTVDKLTGKIVSTHSAGQIGKGTSGGGANGETYFTKPKPDGKIGYYYGNEKSPASAQELTKENYLQGVSKAAGVLDPNVQSSAEIIKSGQNYIDNQFLAGKKHDEILTDLQANFAKGLTTEEFKTLLDYASTQGEANSKDKWHVGKFAGPD